MNKFFISMVNILSRTLGWGGTSEFPGIPQLDGYLLDSDGNNLVDADGNKLIGYTRNR